MELCHGDTTPNNTLIFSKILKLHPFNRILNSPFSIIYSNSKLRLLSFYFLNF